MSEKRLSLTPHGSIRYQLKTPYLESLPHERSECFGHGNTHVIFKPLDFIARLARPGTEAACHCAVEGFAGCSSLADT